VTDLLAGKLARLTPEQRALLLRSLQPKANAPERAITRRADSTAPLPLSPAQQRMWFLEQLQPGSGAYYVYSHMRLTGALDREAMVRAWQQLVQRHEALRTTFRSVDGVPRQFVGDGSNFAVELREGTEAQLEELLNESLRPFDLERGPLARVTLVRLAGEEHLLLATYHHIIADGWSLDVLDGELRALYRGEALPDLELQFGDVVAWQAQPEQQAKLEAQLGWWKETLAGVPDLLDLPTDRPRPALQSFRGARVTAHVPAGMHDFALREHVTPFMLLLAAFQAVLARVSGQSDFVVGTPVAGRMPESEGLVGMFVGSVGIRTALQGDPTFRELLQRVRDAALDAFAHQDVPLERIVDALALERSAGRTPLFQTMLVVTSGTAGHHFEGLQADYVHPEETAARFDLTLNVGNEDDGRLRCFFDYATDLFDEATIAALARHFVTFLHAAVAYPDTRVSALPLVTRDERARILAASEGPRVTRPEATLHQLFAEQAARTPDALAILAEGQSVTYAELDRWSDEIASTVQGEIVAFEADRSAKAIAALLGILKAGAAYLPLDPSLPQERREWMIQDSGAEWLRGCEVAGYRNPETSNPRNPGDLATPRPASAAYVIYTSGSTGTPKGVAVEHRSAVNLALAFADIHEFAGHRVLMIPPLSFDASVGDVFPALLSGAALVLHPSPGSLSGQALSRFCAENHITAIDAPAALWRRWSEEWTAGSTTDPLPDVRLMMVGGESVPTDEVRRFAKLTGNRIELVNHYGPTEATVCATTCHTVDAREITTGELPIGKPIANVSAYILDQNFEPVPDGVAGELYLGGIGVAHGYLGRPEQTAERFLENPFAPGRMYRTGDLARRLRDGSLLFLGRADRQIKLRGFRIEPAEIEAALLAQPGVRAAVVIKRDERLVAYVAGDAELEPLRERLPDYMIPSSIVSLDELPLTSNGKIDLRALPAPTVATHASRPPRTEDERALLAIWSEVLGHEVRGIDDDFFVHGGDSLRTMPLMFKVRQHFGVDLPLTAIFNAPTVARFAPLLAGHAAEVISLEARAAAWQFELAADRAAAWPPRAILLTGATGFLGAFILEELLRASKAIVYCLVRARDHEEGMRRIIENLAAYRLAVDVSRIEPLLGDLGQPGLGLDDATRAHLAENLDLIIHNGGYVSFVTPYELHEAANVIGTREVLRLAATSCLKPVHHVSTLGVHFTEARIGTTVTERDPLPPGAGMLGGYNQSKWVADANMQRARDAGLPVTIHRPSRIVGDSRTGAFNAGDFFSSWVKGCVQLGAFPDEGSDLFMSPVDVIARAVVRTALDAGAEPRDYHYFNHDGISLPSFVEALRRHGIHCRITPYGEWKDAMLASEGNAFARFTSLLPDGPGEEPFFDTTESARILAARGVTHPPTAEFVERWLAKMTAQEVEVAT
jgi:amino acid adenylation domain-containing protein/thioester reductase-like protein